MSQIGSPLGQLLKNRGCDSSSERGSHYSNTLLEKPMETKDYAILSNSKIRKERESR
jgi:hypothetical protein